MVDNDQIFSHGIKHDPCYDCILVVICQQVMFADMAPIFSWVISTCTKTEYGASPLQVPLPWLTGVFLFDSSRVGFSL